MYIVEKYEYTIKNNEKSTCNNQNIKMLNIREKNKFLRKNKACFFYKKLFLCKKDFVFFFIYISTCSIFLRENIAIARHCEHDRKLYRLICLYELKKSL